MRSARHVMRCASAMGEEGGRRRRGGGKRERRRIESSLSGEVCRREYGVLVAWLIDLGKREMRCDRR